MMAYLILALLLVVGIAAFFMMRKPGVPELPPKQEPPKPLPKAEAKPEKKLEQKAEQPPREPVEKRVSERPKEVPVVPEQRKPSERPLATSTPPVPVAPEEDFSKASTYDPVVLRRGLAKTRTGLVAKLANLLMGRKQIDPAVLSQIEEVLLTSDVGPKTTQLLVERLTERLRRNELEDEERVWAALREEALALFGSPQRMKLRGKPTVLLMVGVNGAGKTTTIAKIASKLRDADKTVVLAAGDTFRAAAVAQLEEWGKRVGAEVVKGKEGADASSVLFDAVKLAKDSKADVLLCDTAGRLHSKVNLMEELGKLARTLDKALPGAPHETLLVLDATNGQNALAQARQFQETIPLTGVVLTKLDGTAKGGVVLAIADELKLPVRYIGIGERAADLREFDAAEFVDALFSSREGLSTEAA